MIDYFKDKKSNDFKNSGKFWEFYRSHVKLKSDGNNEDLHMNILLGDEIVTDKQEIATVFNEFFTNLNSQTVFETGDCNRFIFQQFKDLNLQIKEEFNFAASSPIEINKLLDTLDSKCSPGISKIPSKILKYSSDILSSIFNFCLDNRVLPSEWKCAIVKPLYKNKGNKNDLNSYRGISMLPPVAKIFEKVCSKQILNHFINNNLFTSAQHGFRKSHSCEPAIHELVNDCYKKLEKKLTSILLFIDFRKAFDLVDPELLLLKLLNYGFSNKSIMLLRNYFDQRKQLGIYTSEEIDIILGVPQGSILGPLLFLIYINDLPSFISEFSSKMFADDTTIYNSDSNIDNLMTHFNKNIPSLIQWCKYNKMDINWSKTFIMFIRPPRCN